MTRNQHTTLYRTGALSTRGAVSCAICVEWDIVAAGPMPVVAT